MAKVLEGSCLCGAVHFRTDGEPMLVGDCYCIDCRKSSATSHSTHVAVPESSVTLSGPLTYYDRAADSGNMVSRGFCPTCGSPVVSRNSAMPGALFLRASILDDPDAINPQMAVYASRAPKWATFPEGQTVHAEMPEGGPQQALGTA